jgi:hypothetical protein
MRAMNDNSNKTIAGLSRLAVEWRAMLENWCPPDWRQMLPTLNLEQPDRMLPANPLPVLSFLSQMEVQAPPYNHPFVNNLNSVQSDLHFNQTYSTEDFGADFLQQYGWIKFLGPDAYWHSDLLSSGFVLLGDNITYPQHCHVAEELYFPISGTGDWYHENYGWQTKSPGDRIEHASNIKHSMRTSGEPLLLLYIWRGGNPVQKSEFN